VESRVDHDMADLTCSIKGYVNPLKEKSRLGIFQYDQKMKFCIKRS